MGVKILGCGEAFETDLGNNSFLYEGDPTLLFDCGYQVPPLLWREKKIYGKLDGIYLTHLHADHFFGLPPLLYRFLEEGRTRDLWLLGFPGLTLRVAKVCQLGYPGLLKKLSFALRFHEMVPGKVFEWRNLQLRGELTRHSVPNMAVRVDLPRGKSFGISGDGKLTVATCKLFTGVDLLFHEVYHIERDHPHHSNLREVSAFFEAAQVGKLVVTHVARGERMKMERVILKRKDPRFCIGSPGEKFHL